MNNKGFTLIELLVVVLIIGILAAIALPQYMKAVEKSRASEALTLLGNLANAEHIYNMSQGSYTTDLAALDITLPCVSDTTVNTNNFQISTAVNSTTGAFTATATRTINGAAAGGDRNYAIVASLSSTGILTRSCNPGTSASDGAKAMCKTIANGANPDSSGNYAIK